MYMNTDEINEELAVMQLSDSFFPTGLYATSNGLEFLFSNNEINGIEDIKNMIKVNIEQQIGPSDCVALSNAFTNAEKKDFKEIIQADEIAFIMKPIKEIRKASVNSGIQLIKCVSEFVKDDDIFNEYQKTFEKLGIETCIRTPELASNKAIAALWKNFEPVTYKKRCTYKKDL